MDRTSLDAQTREQTLLLVLIGGITFVAVGVMLTGMLRITVVNPLAKLAASARRIAEGNLSTRADVTGKDEVSMVANNFNEMAERVEQDARALEDSKAELERRVKQRTNELEKVSQQLRHRNKERGDLLGKIIRTQEEERQRIARELHDQTGQSLSSLMIGLKTLETASQQDIQQRIADMRQLMAQTLDEVHSLALEIRPNSLDDLGLISVLEQYTKEYADKFGIITEFQAIGVGRRLLSPEVEIAIYRILQEALINVAKHAEAKKVSVLLEVRDSSVIAIVEDDGKGFNIKKDSGLTSIQNQLGLYGMYERAELIGGKITIESNPGRGTTVFMEVPLSRKES
jgi:signal transduction histidine kinase